MRPAAGLSYGAPVWLRRGAGRVAAVVVGGSGLRVSIRVDVAHAIDGAAQLVRHVGELEEVGEGNAAFLPWYDAAGPALVALYEACDDERRRACS